MSDWNLNVKGPLEGLSLYEKFPPRIIGLAEQFAKKSNENNDLQGFMSNARMGIAPDDQEKVMQEQRLAELTQQFAQSTQELDDTEYQQAAEQFAAKFGAPMPQRKQAELQNISPIQGLFSVLGMALNPEFAGDIGAATLQGNVNERDRQQGINDQQYNDQLRQREEGIQGAQAKMTIEERRLGKRESSQDRQASLINRQISDTKEAISKLDERQQKVLQAAMSRYQNANTPAEKAKAGRELQSLLGKDSPFAPTEDEIAKDVQQLSLVNNNKARLDWESALNHETDDFGQVSDARFKDLESQRIAIAQAYGIDPNTLRKTPTERTLKEEAQAFAHEKFAFLKDKTAEDFKLKYAKFQFEKQKAQNNMAVQADRLKLGYGNLNQRAIANQLATIRLREKEVGDSAASQVKKLQGLVNVAAAKAAANPTDSNNGKLAEARAVLNQFVQETAQELGISPDDFVKDPQGSLKKMFPEGEKIEAPKITLPPGQIGGYATPQEQKKSNAALKRKPTKKQYTLPKGWSAN